MQLAEINVARLRYPLDDPRVAEFVANLDRVNALAEASPGFVWRLKDEAGNATQIRAYDDPLIIVNMSAWASAEELYKFAYQTMHRRFVQRRKEWFDLFGAAYLALWWIEDGRYPDVSRANASRPPRTLRPDRIRLQLPQAVRAGHRGQAARRSRRWTRGSGDVSVVRVREGG